MGKSICKRARVLSRSNSQRDLLHLNSGSYPTATSLAAAATASSSLCAQGQTQPSSPFQGSLASPLSPASPLNGLVSPALSALNHDHTRFRDSFSLDATSGTSGVGSSSVRTTPAGAANATNDAQTDALFNTYFWQTKGIFSKSQSLSLFSFTVDDWKTVLSITKFYVSAVGLLWMHVYFSYKIDTYKLIGMERRVFTRKLRHIHR